MAAAIPIVSFVGRSGSGKTTLVEKLVRELKRRGHRLAVIKHHHHADFEFDVPGKDSYRFAQAGADHVVVAGPSKVVHVRQVASEPTLEEITEGIRDVDLIITEGYKRADTPKIEVRRRDVSDGAGADAGGGSPCEIVSPLDQLVAIVSDRCFDLPVPQFGLEDVRAVADLVESIFHLGGR